MIQTIRLIFLHGNLVSLKVSNNLDSDTKEKLDPIQISEEDLFSMIAEMNFKKAFDYVSGKYTNIVFQRDNPDLDDIEFIAQEMQKSLFD